MAKLRCPRCRQMESFGVEHLSSVEWVWDQTVEDYLHGLADPGEPHGGDQAVTTCAACTFKAPLLQFELPELPEPERRRRRGLLAEIESRRSLGAAKDSWETKRLHPLNFDPESVARFCSEPERRFSAFALVSLVHTLVNEFGVERTESAFANAKVAVTQHLQRWLEALDDPVP